MKEFKKDYIQRAIKALNFEKLTEIQENIIPEAIKGRDVIGVSETGSGKTHAFLLPIFERLDESDVRVQAVIVAPTRELAKQIETMARIIAEHSDQPIKIRTYSGGEDRNREIERLRRGAPHIVIGTPGKLYDLAIKENHLPLHQARTLIIDEADMALDAGFLSELEAIINTVPKTAQFMVFSATMVKPLRDTLKKVMRHPLEVVLETQRLKQLPIKHHFIKTNPDKVIDTLDALLSAINPYLALVFANTKEEAETVAGHLHQNGLKVTSLHGDLSSRTRKQVLRDINNLNVQYIVASDMASRGIDIKGISHIINLAFPRDMSFYIHRSGRTGRMGQSGKVYTIYTDRNHEAFKYLLKENVTLHFIDVKHKEIIPKKQDEKILNKAVERPPKRKKTIKDTVKPGYKKKYHHKQKKGRS